MAVAQKLEKTSGLFFFGGFFLSKFQYVPFPQISAIFRFVSLGLYFTAYGLWFVANLLHPDHKNNPNKWYGFAQIKEQFLFSSFIGLVATLLSVAAVFIPVLFPPAAILFLIGNTIWTIGEYHKLKNPPKNNPTFSYTSQRNYVSYAMITTAISLISAVSAILIVAFPPIAIPVTIFSVLLCIGLGTFAFQYWLESNLGGTKLAPASDSYSAMSESLGPSVSPEPTNSPEPTFSNSFSWKQKEPKHTELVDLASEEESSKDHGLTVNSSL